MRRVVLIASAFLLAAVRLASAQATGAISGTVTAAADASPIAGATVNAYDATRSIVISVVTDSLGVYTISNVAAGTYYLRISRDGFVPVAYANIPCAAQSCFSNGVLGVMATPVMVTAGSTATVNVALDRGATIAGALTRAADGTAVASVAVRLYDASTNPVATARSAADGTYTFSGVPFGTYFARTDRSGTSSIDLDILYGGALCPGGATPRCRIDSGTPIVVTSGSASGTANFSLPAGGKILGSVVSVHPFAFLEFPIALYQGSTLTATTASNSTGGYTFAGLDPGTYFVRTAANSNDLWYRDVCVGCPGAHPTPVPVTAGATTPAIDFHVSFANVDGISGTLTLNGLAGAIGARIPDVQIYNTVGELVETWTGGLAQAGGDTVQWSVSGLPPGTYYVRTSSFSLPSFHLLGFGALPASGYWVDKLYDNQTCVAADCDPRLGTPVVVTNGAVTPGINFALDFGALITGTLDAGFAGGATLVEVYDARGVRLPQRSGTQSSDASSHTYAALGLPAGTYYLVATSLPTGVSRVLYSGVPCHGCSVTSGTPVTVSLGEQKTGINFSVIADRRISGTVRSDSSATPASQPLSTIGVEAYGPGGQLASSTTTLADGTYAIGQLAAGTYTIRTRNARGFVDQAYGSAVVVPSGGDVTGIDFALSQGQTISGQMLAAGGGALSGAGIVAYASSPAAPAAPAAHGTTDPFGGYSLTVPAGSYFVQTDPLGGYAQQIYNSVACPQGICSTASATPIVVGATAVTGINFNLPVCVAPSIAPISLANAAVGVAYRQTLLATGATGGVRFAVSSGTPPPGLTLDPITGVLSGTPTTSGQFTFTVSAVDSAACAGSRTYTLDVPSCALLGPSQFFAPAAGYAVPDLATGTIVLQTCEDPFAVSADVPWIRGFRLPVFHTDFTGVLRHWAIAFVVDPNTSLAQRTGHLTFGSRTMIVSQSGTASSPPFGVLESPQSGQIVSGSIAVSGWALDDVGVTRLAIYRDPVAGESGGLAFIGTATFVDGARPDVEAAYPTMPGNRRAGWGYLLLTNMLPNRGNGVFNIYAFAEDGQSSSLLGVRTITAVNGSATAPFGAIDTPGQGAVASGSQFVNFGWALTPQPKLIPFDGSMIDVLIDGVSVGTVTAYNFFRSDVSTLFPGLKNSGGPVGYRIIDTTALSEGLHTIAWIVTDDAGATNGIGSRYFTVQNSAWQPSLRAKFAAAPPAFSASEIAHADATTAVPPRVDGVDLGRKAMSLASLPLDAGGSRTVEMSALQVLELSLSSVGQGFSPDSTCSPTYEGYFVVNGELRALPVGSSLDPAGTFYWHPGAGFFGTYRLIFVRAACGGTKERIPVTIQVK